MIAKPRSFYLAGLIIVLLVKDSLEWRSFKIIFTSVEAKLNKEMVEAKIDIGTNANEETVLNAKINILQPLDDLEISYALEMMLDPDNYTTILNRSRHLCNFLNNRSIDPILKFVHEGLLKQGNFIKSCPIQKGTYFFHEYRIDEETMPSYVPETNFQVGLHILKRSKTNPVSVVSVKVSARVDKSKGFTNLKLFTMGK